MNIIDDAVARGERFLSEYHSKKVLAEYGIPTVAEIKVDSLGNAKLAAKDIRFPVVLKGLCPGVTHKTEKDLVILNINSESDLETAFEKLGSSAKVNCQEFLVQEMIHGQRELIVGFMRDPQFGPCVMLGLGGIFTEILRDVSFRLAPLTERDVEGMMNDLRCNNIFGPIRGMKEVNKNSLIKILVSVGALGIQYRAISEIDINPIIMKANGDLIAVDALIKLSLDS